MSYLAGYLNAFWEAGLCVMHVVCGCVYVVCMYVGSMCVVWCVRVCVYGIFVYVCLC